MKKRTCFFKYLNLSFDTLSQQKSGFESPHAAVFAQEKFQHGNQKDL